MTRDEIIKMARGAGFRTGHIDLHNSDPLPFVAPCSATDCLPELERFAALVAAPSVPDGWLRAIDEALVTAHVGVANAHDTYEQAKTKLNNLICSNVDIATDPAVNGGYKLVPIASTNEMNNAGLEIERVYEISGKKEKQK